MAILNEERGTEQIERNWMRLRYIDEKQKPKKKINEEIKVLKDIIVARNEEWEDYSIRICDKSLSLLRLSAVTPDWY